MFGGVLKSVFKTILSFIFIMIAFDTAVFVYDATNINIKVNKIADIIEKDLAEHNGLPSAMIPVYNEMLDDVINRSYIAQSYETNFEDVLGEAESLSYDSDAGNVLYDYGDLMDLKIKVYMGYSLTIQSFEQSGKADSNGQVNDSDKTNLQNFADNGTSVMKDKATQHRFKPRLTVDRTVPALRYLK